jgi:hypothetical protein
LSLSVDWLGWIATALFASSYLCRRPTTLRLVQGAAALLWVGYGAFLHAVPIVVANLIVMLLAVGSVILGPGRQPGQER